MVRDAALEHLNELDPVAGRTLILRELLDVNARPSLKVIGLLPKEDIASAVPPAVERIAKGNPRDLDYKLLDNFAGASFLPTVQGAFEAHQGKWSCTPPAAMLRYFLRADPAYGAKQVKAALARKDTRCSSRLLQELGDQLPNAQENAIEALNDPDPKVVLDAVSALGLWGSAEAESALWTRLRRFHKEWAGQEGELRLGQDNARSAGWQAAALEHVLVRAIAAGKGWICPPESLGRLADLTWAKYNAREIASWIKQWVPGPAVVGLESLAGDKPTFRLVQYTGLTEEQLGAKVAQLPSGTHLLWGSSSPAWRPPAALAATEPIYERIRRIAEKNGVVLERAGRP
jgi:hypothetical protein